MSKSAPPKIIDPQTLITLSSIPGVGSSKLRALVSRFGSTLDILSASHQELINVRGIDSGTANRILEFRDGGFAREQISRMEASGGRLVTFWDEEYPVQLKNIYDPPAFLFVRGSFEPKDQKSVGIVGTRTPSSYGKLVTERITAELAGQGLTIVSGLAYGIDTLAHNQALLTGARTIAVLGSGIDVIYPRENRKLADRIVNHGVVASEFTMGSGPDRTNFPRRNRIICGLSLGTLVVEAGPKSGALITASMALDQNREVFAIPGNIDSPNSVGTNELIKQGAKLVTSSEDILDELRAQIGQLEPSDAMKVADLRLTAEEEAVFTLLDHQPRHIDALSSTLQESTSQVLATLLSLELRNVVKQLTGKYFVKV